MKPKQSEGRLLSFVLRFAGLASRQVVVLFFFLTTVPVQVPYPGTKEYFLRKSIREKLARRKKSFLDDGDDDDDDFDGKCSLDDDFRTSLLS